MRRQIHRLGLALASTLAASPSPKAEDGYDLVALPPGFQPRPGGSVMLQSRQAAVDYMTPLGLHHLMGAGHHYGPAPWFSGGPRSDWTSVYYHRADSEGIGFDRTPAGSGCRRITSHFELRASLEGLRLRSRSGCLRSHARRQLIHNGDVMPQTRVTLREVRDELGVRILEAILGPDGILTIEGQDLGDGVEQFFGPGNREYEWIWTIRPPEVAKLAAALGSAGDVLAGLQARFTGKAAADLQPFLEEHGIVYQGWSRVGD